MVSAQHCKKIKTGISGSSVPLMLVFCVDTVLLPYNQVRYRQADLAPVWVLVCSRAESLGGQAERSKQVPNALCVGV